MKIRITVNAWVSEEADLKEIQKRAEEAFWGIDPEVEVEAL